MSTPPLVPAEGMCHGRKMVSGGQLGLCIGCERHRADGRMKPEARRERTDAAWHCVNFAPIGTLRVAPVQQATNVVKVRGEKLAPIEWQGVQWAVTAYGLEARDGTYAIEKRHLLERRGTKYEWPEHMGEKGWVDMADFRRAFAIALHIHHGVPLPEQHRNAAGA